VHTLALMRHEEHSWTTFDGITVYAQSWAPHSSPRAVVALVHGLGDHSGRFPALVEGLTAAGFAVSGFDERGHGRTGGPRVHAPSYAALMKDIDSHLEVTRKRFPGIQLFLYGQSHGGAQVLFYGLDRSPAVRGIIASSPAIRSGVPQPAVKVLFAKALSRLLPTMRVPLGSPAVGISSDPAWLETTKNDPLFQEGLSVRLATEMLRAQDYILAHKSFPVPLLIMQGTEDLHVSPDATISFAKSLPGDVTLKVWEGMRHELHNEVRRNEVVAFMRHWLETHLR
jgi:alpha-beta hydrolase superfamily lysophospholipase